MNKTEQRLGVWCGALFSILFGAGLMTAGWLPLPSPMQTPAEVVAMYQTHTIGIRIGVALMIVGVGFFFPFVALLSHHLRRMQCSRLAAYMQMLGGAGNALIIMIPMMILGVAAFRPERDPQILYALNDLGWLLEIPALNPAFAQLVGVAWGVFADRGATPVFPRWYGYLSLWVAITFLPAPIAFFFKSGPFAWNGIIAFYIPAAAFFAWVLVSMRLLLKAIDDEAAAS